VTAHPAHSLIERLATSRRALVAALAERTERDFAHPVGGDFGERSLGRALADLASAERHAVDDAAGRETDTRELPDQPLPPQVMHELAGVRHRTVVYLDALDDPSAAEPVVEDIVAREDALTAQLIATEGRPAAQ
jgi:hypothetical protein